MPVTLHANNLKRDRIAITDQILVARRKVTINPVADFDSGSLHLDRFLHLHAAISVQGDVGIERANPFGSSLVILSNGAGDQAKEDNPHSQQALAFEWKHEFGGNIV